MYQAMNATGLDEQPVLEGGVAMSLYFIVFICICVFFMLNLVIGVAIDQVRESGQVRGRLRPGEK
jgi:voltage-dependent calcium channel T type alpha-1G